MGLEDYVISEKRCINQIFKQKEYFENIIRNDHHGRCSICKTDNDNIYCSGYVPITDQTYFVNEDNEH